jgi:hypothetical protein
MVDKSSIAKAFCTAYFAAMSSDRGSIGKFYRERSTLTFQGQEFSGVAAIQAKLNALGSSDGVPAKIEYKITKCVVQVSKAPNSLVMLGHRRRRVDRLGSGCTPHDRRCKAVVHLQRHLSTVC